jgi:serine/threonine protein kinase
MDCDGRPVQPPERLGPFRLTAEIGRGAMAVTYRAEAEHLRAPVALKVPHAKHRRDPSFAVRFLQEAALGRRLRHPNIVRVLDAGESDGVPYLAMELVRGMSLREGLRAAGRFSQRRAVAIVGDVASALEHAHAQGVIHRDLKPANIMVQASGPLKVMDFGIAKVLGEDGLTSSNLILGSPAYAAPEITGNRPVDHRQDLYALGIILFELIQGSPPFTDSNAVRVLLRHQSEPLPDRPDLDIPVDPGVWRLITALLEKDPDRRMATARGVRVASELLARG